MKSTMIQLRLDPETKTLISEAAAFDRRSLSSFLLVAADCYINSLRYRGFKAKEAPQPRDARRKAA